jgi:glutathione synthase
MKRDIGVVMDPIGSIKIAKDSTFAMLLAAQARLDPWYMELGDLFLLDGMAQARMRPLRVSDDRRAGSSWASRSAGRCMRWMRC